MKRYLLMIFMGCVCYGLAQPCIFPRDICLAPGNDYILVSNSQGVYGPELLSSVLISGSGDGYLDGVTINAALQQVSFSLSEDINDLDDINFSAFTFDNELSAVAISGDYEDLNNKPVLVQNGGNVTGNINLDAETFTLTASGSGDSSFDSDRPVLRTLEIGDVVGGSTIQDLLEYMYFSPPSLSLSKSPSTSTYEVGTSTVITLSTSTSNAGGSALSNGILRKTSGISQDISTFGASTSHNFDITFTPQQGGTGSYNELEYRFRAYQDWTGGGSSGTAQSMETTVRAAYPVLYGMASTDTSAVLLSLYTALSNKVVTQETDLTVTYTGSGLIYFAFPQTWNDTNLSQILDPNGFDVTASFTRVDYPEVTSSGLVNNYNDVDYVVYFLNTGSTTASASQYQFIR